MRADEVLAELRAQANPENVAGMARYGISEQGTLGVPMPVLRALARRIGRDHELAAALWDSGVHEARILACLVDDPKQVTEAQMERWVRDIDSWDICDQCCGSLFDRTPWAYAKAIEWAGRKETFVKRAGFVLMTQLAVHDKQAADDAFLPFLPVIVREATDERNFVRKAVNWALRQIGKRSPELNEFAIATSHRIREIDSSTARWIASDALRELTSKKVRDRLQNLKRK
jgi:3-methyladenine DNA glycosylase AlkD